MSDWNNKPLGEVLTLQRGFDLPKRLRTPGRYPIVSSSGITGSHDEFKVSPPGVVIGRYGSLGTVHWITEPFWPLNTSLWVKDFKGNDPRYISYLLQTVSMDGSGAAAVPGVNRNHLHKIPVHIPATHIQKRIAAVLDAFDQLIRVNERRIGLLEQQTLSCYRHMTKQPPKGIEWKSCTLGEVSRFKYGKALPKARRHPGDVSVVSSAGIIGHHDTALSSGPGLIVGRKGNVGSVWWVQGPFFPIDTTYYVESDLPLEFLYWALQEVEFIDSHAAVPGLSRDQALGARISVPPEDVITKIVSVHRSAFQAISAFQNIIGNTRRILDLLLPRLMTGQLDISDIDLGSLTPTEIE